jgi:hypothetical protein
MEHRQQVLQVVQLHLLQVLLLITLLLQVEVAVVVLIKMPQAVEVLVDCVLLYHQLAVLVQQNHL